MGRGLRARWLRASLCRQHGEDESKSKGVENTFHGSNPYQIEIELGFNASVDALRAAYYIQHMIVGFKNRATERLWHGERVRAFDAFAQAASRKLVMLEYAHALSDLRAPPGNQLEALSGNRKGQHSIRISRQWRICFVWTANGPDQVEIVDYH
jgi:toxin HigB-1